MHAYVPALDGLRGAMVLAVIAHHLDPGRFAGAVIYMDTFFVMSSYLITSLLLRDIERTGRIDFGAFYRRRILRLAPALYLMLAIFVLAVLLLAQDPTGHLQAAMAAGLFVSNWTRAFGIVPSDWLDHTWSLAVEEQFYLLWPLLLLALLRGFGVGLRTVCVLLLLAFVAAAWRAWIAHSIPAGADVNLTIVRMYNGLDTRADALLLGAALAVAMRLPVRQLALRFTRHLALPALAVMLVAGNTLNGGMLWLYAGGSLLFSLLSMLLICSLLRPEPGIATRLLSWPPLTATGRMCYGLYLWHFPIFCVMRIGLGLDQVWLLAVGLPLTFALAIASYRFIERPLLDAERRRDDAVARPMAT
jgi:peptidoglycan/LPS O-acetylase OafA/YrhL